MAILNSSMFRGARKQAGGWVLYKVGGQTIAREVASQVSNPRTPAQMDNRVRLQNVVSVYRANRAWMKGAFENKKQKESDYNAFVSANLSSSQVAFTKQQAAAGAAVAAPYQISSGSLGSIEQVISETELQTNIYLGSLSLTPATKVGEFAYAVINNNNGIVQGMQLSLILNIQQVNQATGIPYIITRAYEVVLDPQSQELLSLYYPGGILAGGGGADNILYADLADEGSGAASFILSHTVAATTRVSEQSLLMYGSQTVYNQYTTNEAIAAAVASYGENEVNFLDSNSAQSSSSVPLTVGISALSYHQALYSAGSQVPGPLDPQIFIYFYLTQAAIGGTLSDVSLKNVVLDENVDLQSTTLSESGLMITTKVSQSYPVYEMSRMRFQAKINGEQVAFEFFLMPAE